MSSLIKSNDGHKFAVGSVFKFSWCLRDASMVKTHDNTSGSKKNNSIKKKTQSKVTQMGKIRGQFCI